MNYHASISHRIDYCICRTTIKHPLRVEESKLTAVAALYSERTPSVSLAQDALVRARARCSCTCKQKAGSYLPHQRHHPPSLLHHFFIFFTFRLFLFPPTTTQHSLTPQSNHSHKHFSQSKPPHPPSIILSTPESYPASSLSTRSFTMSEKKAIHFGGGNIGRGKK